MSQKWEKNKLKVCFVESSFGQKVWSTFPVVHNEGPTLGQKGGKDQKVDGCHKKEKGYCT